MNTMDADRKGGCDMFETCVSDNGIVYYPSHMKKKRCTSANATQTI